MDYFDGTRKGRRRDAAYAVGVLLLALFVFSMPDAYQAPVRQTVRGSVLRPFLALQAQVVARRASGQDVTEIRAERDSLAAVVAAQAALVEENRRLRSLLGLHARAEQRFIAAELLRIGGLGGESVFVLSAGRADGIDVESPVLTPDGLLGVVRDVDDHTAHAMDWTHPQFRASAMTADGEVDGIVEPRRGEFREEDMLALRDAPFHSDIQPGTQIVTSGRGGIYPRGIPLGTVIGLEEADTGWRKSYLLRPAVRPAAVTHVLVGVREYAGDGEPSFPRLWRSADPDAGDEATADTPSAGGGAGDQGTP